MSPALNARVRRRRQVMPKKIRGHGTPTGHRPELILNNFMREFSDLSIKNWVEFIRSFTTPKIDQGELWDLSKEALLSVKLEILKPTGKSKTNTKKKGQ